MDRESALEEDEEVDEVEVDERVDEVVERKLVARLAGSEGETDGSWLSVLSLRLNCMMSRAAWSTFTLDFSSSSLAILSLMAASSTSSPPQRHSSKRSSALVTSLAAICQLSCRFLCTWRAIERLGEGIDRTLEDLGACRGGKEERQEEGRKSGKRIGEVSRGLKKYIAGDLPSLFYSRGRGG